MKSKRRKRPKLSILHEEVPRRLQEVLHLTRLAEMGRLAASVAHEINNPLMVAQGFAENIELLLDNPEIARDSIRIQALEIIKACQRMSRIVSKMNRMSRSHKLRLHVVDIADVVLNAVDFFRSQMTDLEVQLEFDFAQPLPVRCDTVQIEQIVINLLSNALFALEKCKGQRRIRIAFAEVGKRWHQVKVWNNGPPIPEDIQKLISRPFFTTKPEGRGTGLGLSISKSIMQLHGGDLSFKSHAHAGTEFVLSFPRPKRNPWSACVENARGPVMIIDRQAPYRRTLQEKFRLLGFDVRTQPDYASGLKALKAKPVACVLVDVIPGQRESLEFVRRVRRLLGPSARLFTVSNFPSARDSRTELRAAGATECFEKPLHAKNFDLILNLLDAPALDAPDKVAA